MNISGASGKIGATGPDGQPGPPGRRVNEIKSDPDSNTDCEGPVGMYQTKSQALSRTADRTASQQTIL